MSRRACGSAAWRLGGLAALRLCGFAACAFHGSFAALRLCGFAACAFHGGFAALRLERSMAALRLCGFDAFQGARVYPNPRAMVSLCFFFVSGLSFLQVLSCSFGSSHSLATSP